MARLAASARPRSVYSTDEDTCIDTLVVGGGLQGSTAAFYLQQKGVDCRLAEANARLGGNVVSRKGNCRN
jgi:heterodisulfide reductase subunit A-like polyferredoxin